MYIPWMYIAIRDSGPAAKAQTESLDSCWKSRGGCLTQFPSRPSQVRAYQSIHRKALQYYLLESKLSSSCNPTLSLTNISQPYDLTRHEDTIHNARKQKVRCQYCTEDKSFSRSDALTRHMSKYCVLLSRCRTH